MAREGVSFENVQSAVIALEAEGRSVTLRSVRDHLGTGSMSTIGQHLQRIRESARQPVETVLPDAVAHAVATAIAQQAEQVRGALARELEAAQDDVEAMSAQVDQLERTIVDQQTRVTVLETTEQRLTGKLEAAEAQVKEAEDEARQQIEAAKAEAEEQRRQAEMARTEGAKAALQVEAMREAVDKITDENRNLHTRLEATLVESAAVGGKLERAEARTAEALDQVKAAKAEAKEAISEARAEAKDAALDAREQVKEARAEVEEARVAARVAEEHAAKAERELEILKGKLATAEGACD
ncbi:MAG: DNA-binding protein [Candidatus Thiodiazotropha sp.]